MRRSLFATDGSMHHCFNNSTFLKNLEEQQKGLPKENEAMHSVQNSYTVAVIDGMAELQSFHEEPNIGTCDQPASSFVHSLERKYNIYYEVHVVFDRYDVSKSLESATREHRTKTGSKPVAYKIS